MPFDFASLPIVMKLRVLDQVDTDTRLKLLKIRRLRHFILKLGPFRSRVQRIEIFINFSANNKDSLVDESMIYVDGKKFLVRARYQKLFERIKSVRTLTFLISDEESTEPGFNFISPSFFLENLKFVMDVNVFCDKFSDFGRIFGTFSKMQVERRLNFGSELFIEKWSDFCFLRSSFDGNLAMVDELEVRGNLLVFREILPKTGIRNIIVRSTADHGIYGFYRNMPVILENLDIFFVFPSFDETIEQHDEIIYGLWRDFELFIESNPQVIRAIYRSFQDTTASDWTLGHGFRMSQCFGKQLFHHRNLYGYFILFSRLPDDLRTDIPNHYLVFKCFEFTFDSS